MINVEITKHKLSKDVLDCDVEAVEALQEDLKKRIERYCKNFIEGYMVARDKLGYTYIDGEIVKKKKFQSICSDEPMGYTMKEHHEAGLNGMEASGDLYG